MSGKRGRWEEFLAWLGKDGRMTVPYEVRKGLGLRHGDLLRVRVRREKAEG